MRYQSELVIADLDLIAELFIAKDLASGGFWYKNSRNLLKLLAIYLFETKGSATFGEIYDIVMQLDFFGWLESQVSSGSIASPYFQPLASTLIDADHETRDNIISDFKSRMSIFLDPLIRYATSDNDFDLRNLRKQKMSIYIHIPDSNKERIKQLLTLLYGQMIGLLSESEPNLTDEPYPVLAIMDEFGNMAKINKLKEGASFLRSYRIRYIVIVQRISQILAEYGQNDADAFLDSKIKVAFTLTNFKDAAYFSEHMGKKTVKVMTNAYNSGHSNSSGSRSKNTSFQSRALMSPDEILQMKEKYMLVMVEGSPPIKAEKCYWFREPCYKYRTKQ